MSSSVHIDNSTLTAEAEYSIKFPRSRRKFCLSLHYDGSNSFLFVNATKIYQFKAKDSERKIYPLCLENISRGFAFNNMKKLGLNGHLNEFYVDYSIIIYWKDMIYNNA